MDKYIDSLLKVKKSTYVMDVQGEFDWFGGKESMYYKDELVYELSFHGEKIIDKHFD